MKTLVCAFLLVVFVVAEPPRYRLARFRPEKQESEKEPTTPKAEEAPYPAAGFRPPKEFKLPSREEPSPPATSYGVPADSYGAPFHTFVAPQVEYGVPEFRSTESLEKKDEGENKEEGEKKEKKEKVEKKSEKKESEEKEHKEKEHKEKETEEKESRKENLKEEPKKESEVLSAQGAYYVLLPDFQLQRVQFQTENDFRNMAYTARLQYKSEERAPVYVYTSVPQYGSSAYVSLI